MANINEFETALVKRLSGAVVDKTFLKSISNSIVSLKKQGLVIDQVHIKGQYGPDRFIINGIVDPSFWGKFRELGGAFQRFEVFPYGIVNPEGFKFKATLGR